MNKQVPDCIKQAPKAIIERFLESAVLGDGWSPVRKANQKPYRTIATISRRLADDYQELFIKIGKASNLKVRDDLDGKPMRGIDGTSSYIMSTQYHVHECHHPKASLDGGGNGKREYLGRMIDYVGPVYCATVPNGTLICRRKGKSFIAGNCKVYGRGAAAIAGMDRFTETQWQMLEQSLGLIPGGATEPDGNADADADAETGAEPNIETHAPTPAAAPVPAYVPASTVVPTNTPAVVSAARSQEVAQLRRGVRGRFQL